MKTLILLFAMLYASNSQAQSVFYNDVVIQGKKYTIEVYSGKTDKPVSYTDTTGTWARDMELKHRNETTQILRELKKIKKLLLEIKAGQDSLKERSLILGHDYEINKIVPLSKSDVIVDTLFFSSGADTSSKDPYKWKFWEFKNDNR